MNKKYRVQLTEEERNTAHRIAEDKTTSKTYYYTKSKKYEIFFRQFK